MMSLQPQPSTWEQIYTTTLHQMKKIWTVKDKTLMRQLLHSTLASLPVDQHHNLVFYLLDRSDDFRNKKYDSMGHVILKEFDDIVKRHEETYEKIIAGLTESFKLGVLQLATMGHPNVLDAMCHSYGLDRPGNDYLATHVRVMLSRHQYKEASICATALNLQHLFDLNEIVLPLIFQDKVNLVEAYLKPHKNLQEELIRTLDSYCGKDFDLKSFVEDFDVPSTGLEKLRSKNLSKLILRLIKLYGLNTALCPNTVQFRNLGTLRYLLYKRYIDKSMSDDTWKELVLDAVGSDEFLRGELIELLLSYNDAPSAARFAADFGIPAQSLHPSVQRAMEELTIHGDTPPQEPEQGAAESWDDEVDADTYYQLKQDNITMVTNADDLRECAEVIMQPGTVVGMDMEWRPCLSLNHTTSDVSLVQLAVSDRVFLLDMVSLGQDHFRQTVEQFFSDFFADPKVIKVGYGSETDFLMLKKSFPFLREPIKQRKSFLDLAIVQTNIVRMNLGLFRYPSSDKMEKGLSELVLLCFGRPLNKMEQMSNWEVRPLRKAQLDYAALDAFCLLELYHFLNEQLQESATPGLSVIKLASRQGKAPPPTDKPKKNKEAARNERERLKSEAFRKQMEQVERHQRPLVPVSDFRVVCDNMLQGLGRYLRACGVDVKTLEVDDDHDKAAKIAREENRMILTSGMPYNTLKSYVGEGCCMNVRSDLKAYDQVSEVIRFFNVRVTSNDIFSRCQVCNGNKYVELSSSSMKRLWLEARLSPHGRAAQPAGATSGPSTLPGGATVSDGVSPEMPPLADLSDNDDDEFLAAEDMDGGEEDMEQFVYRGPKAQQPSGTNHGGEGSSESATGGPTLDTEEASGSRLSEQGLPGKYSPANSLRTDLEIDFAGTKFSNDVVIQVRDVPEGILNQIEVFYVCSLCGKVFWAGGHFQRITKQFSHIIRD